MAKLSESAFRFALTEAAVEAKINLSGFMLEGYKIRDAIDRVGLPLPPVKNVSEADEELKDDPIFKAVKVMAAPPQSQAMAAAEIATQYIAAHVIAAWEHYKSLPEKRGHTNCACMRIGC